MLYKFKTFSDGIQCEYWKNSADMYHREDGPAIIYYYKNGNIKEERWMINGKYHRIDGPAIIKYDMKGNIAEEHWKIKGKWHRENGPADIKYYEDGRIENESWWINGEYHRINGPAIICYNEDGHITEKEYFWNEYKITDFVKKLFGCVPDELTKEEQILLKLSLPEECFT